MAKDKTTNNEIVIDAVHYKVHDEQYYNITYSNTIASGGTTEFYINTGSGKMHATFNIACSGGAKARLLEGVTTTANGTLVKTYNMHRSSTNSCTSISYHSSTWSTNAEVTIYSSLIAGGVNPGNLFGTEARPGTEWILKASTKYLIQIINQAGATITAVLNTEFYET